MVDILMSTYNGEEFLREQLESILGQTYTDWHLFVRDDGSSDDTVAILHDYEARYPDRISLCPDDLHNLGAMRSFERLLAMSKGDYIFFADQDDVWKPNKVEKMMSAIRKEEASLSENLPIVVHSDLEVVDAELRPIASSFWKYSFLCVDLIDAHLQYLAIVNSVTGCAMMMNKAARKVALPFSPYAYMHDASVAVSVKAAGGRVIPLFETLIMYRQHGDNTVGAVAYNFFNGGLKKKWFLAERSYKASHPQVFGNRLSFWFWKLRFFVSVRFRKQGCAV